MATTLLLCITVLLQAEAVLFLMLSTRRCGVLSPNPVGASEDPVSCARDCCSGLAAPRCGDGVCDAFAGENCVTCAADCRGKRVAGSSSGTNSSSGGVGGSASWSYCCGAVPGAGFFFGSGGCMDAKCNKNGAACRTTCVA